MAVLFTAPIGVSAGETSDKAENKVRDTMHEARDEVSDSSLTSKTKIALGDVLAAALVDSGFSRSSVRGFTALS